MHQHVVKFLALGSFLHRASCRLGYPQGVFVSMYICTYAAHPLLHYINELCSFYVMQELVLPRALYAYLYVQRIAKFCHC